jgi:hypothetical protein
MTPTCTYYISSRASLLWKFKEKVNAYFNIEYGEFSI